MKIAERENMENYSLPLPMYKTIHIADAICREGREFDVLVGLDKIRVAQLRELSTCKILPATGNVLSKALTSIGIKRVVRFLPWCTNRMIA